MGSQILTYDEGNTALLTMKFTDPNSGALEDPGTVQFIWQPKGSPTQPVTTWTFGVVGSITRVSLGTFQVALPLVVTNGLKQQRYECRWASSGTWAGSNPFTIVVIAKNV